MPKISDDLTREILARVRETVPENAAFIFERCFRDTLDKAVQYNAEGKAFVLTGDIPAMWLRDSTWQLLPYLHFLDRSKELSDMVAAVCCRQLECIAIDPYANAFNDGPTGAGHHNDHTVMRPEIWERKYEIDSLCSPLHLACELMRRTGRTDHLNGLVAAYEQIVRLFQTEQDHETRSEYRFERPDPLKPTDTLVRDGRGPLVKPTGMVWSAFRPSDDATTYGYNVPGNAFAVLALLEGAAMLDRLGGNASLAAEGRTLADQIEQGIRSYGLQNTADGPVYLYEVDGMGHGLFMDDSNMPAILSMPLLGWCRADDETYLRTRTLLLSNENPYWYEGSCASGMGSPHTAPGYVWPIALAVQGLTSTDSEERYALLTTLCATDAGTGLMHESFDANDPTQFTRPWFSWANAMFCEFVLDLAGLRSKGPMVADLKQRS